MKKATVVISKIDSQNSRMSLRAGVKGTGKVLHSVQFWPKHQISKDKAHEMIFDAAQREGVEIVQPEMN